MRTASAAVLSPQQPAAVLVYSILQSYKSVSTDSGDMSGRDLSSEHEGLHVIMSKRTSLSVVYESRPTPMPQMQSALASYHGRLVSPLQYSDTAVCGSRHLGSSVSQH